MEVSKVDEMNEFSTNALGSADAVIHVAEKDFGKVLGCTWNKDCSKYT